MRPCSLRVRVRVVNFFCSEVFCVCLFPNQIKGKNEKVTAFKKQKNRLNPLPPKKKKIYIYIYLKNKIKIIDIDNTTLGMHVWYAVIGISITKNKRSCYVITITIHLFGDNT
jgi:hypothetical protein